MFGFRKIKNVRSLPSRRQRFKRSFQGREFIKFFVKFFRNNEFCILFNIHFQTGFFHFNGFKNIGFQDGFQLDYFLNIGEPNLARCLYILRLLDENPMGIL